jgi:hypothetical protein
MLLNVLDKFDDMTLFYHKMAALSRQLYRQACTSGRAVMALRHSSGTKSTDLAPQQVFGLTDPLVRLFDAV